MNITAAGCKLETLPPQSSPRNSFQIAATPAPTRRHLQHPDGFHWRPLQVGNRPCWRFFPAPCGLGSQQSSLPVLTTSIGSGWYPSLLLVPLRLFLPLKLSSNFCVTHQFGFFLKRDLALCLVSYVLAMVVNCTLNYYKTKFPSCLDEKKKIVIEW